MGQREMCRFEAYFLQFYQFCNGVEKYFRSFKHPHKLKDNAYSLSMMLRNNLNQYVIVQVILRASANKGNNLSK